MSAIDCRLYTCTYTRAGGAYGYSIVVSILISWHEYFTKYVTHTHMWVISVGHIPPPTQHYPGCPPVTSFSLYVLLRAHILNSQRLLQVFNTPGHPWNTSKRSVSVLQVVLAIFEDHSSTLLDGFSTSLSEQSHAKVSATPRGNILEYLCIILYFLTKASNFIHTWQDSLCSGPEWVTFVCWFRGCYHGGWDRMFAYILSAL